MKALFFLLCFLNICLLLWQYREGGLPLQRASGDAEQPAFLLVAEYQRALRGAEISGFIDNGIEQKVRQWRQADMQRMSAALINRDPWWRQAVAVAASKAKPKPKPKPQAQPVKIVAEAPPLPVPSQPAPAPAPPPTPAPECYLAGPFQNPLVAQHRLKEYAISLGQVVAVPHEVPNDYQVYYPAAKTAERSQQDKQMLYEKGQKDVWLIPAGDIKGAYSLGVFKDKQRAQTLKSQLAEKGISARIKQRNKTEEQWFVRLMLDKQQADRYSAIGLELSVCGSVLGEAM